MISYIRTGDQVTRNTQNRNMAPGCYYEVGVQLNKVKYAVKVPDLHSIKLNKPKLRIKMKKPKMMMRRREKGKRRNIDTSSLSSINIDWKKEFEEKYCELLSKTEKRKSGKISKEKLSQELFNISLIANTSYLSESPVNLSLTEIETEGNENLNVEEENRNLLSSEPVSGRRILKYKYHTLKISKP